MYYFISVLLFIVCVLPELGRAQDAVPENLLTGGEVVGPDLFAENCAVCHGESLMGAAQGTPLIGVDLMHGETVDDLVRVISEGVPEKGMVAWGQVLDAQQIKTLALFIKEHRTGLTAIDLVSEWRLPEGVVKTDKHDFQVELITDALDRFPYSLSVLPDESIVVTEKMYGIRRVQPDGQVSDLIEGTPSTHNDAYILEQDGIEFGSGWILDVQAHPDFHENGWLYLHFTERCRDCGDVMDVDNPPTSRNRVVRGRIQDDRWMDQEEVWTASEFDSNNYLDVVAGGRLAFDPEGYLFMTVGMRDMDRIQDLTSPYGKTHRIHDDGRIPNDNPFLETPGAQPTIWTFGHRSPQGLAFNRQTREVWGTEHGPRGGDELNRLLPGGNYGWPLFSGGQNYDGTEVAHGRETSEVELEDTVLPVVEFTPSIAISNLVSYTGARFDQWEGDFLVGSLKASDLYRVSIRDGEVIDQEVLMADVGRIRDIDLSASGDVYLLLEHQSGGRILKLVPVID